MRRGRHILRLTAALLAASALATPAVAGKADNSLHYATPATLGTVDPYFSNLLGSAQSLWDNVWDTLISRDPETGAYRGVLATAWRRIDDRTLEFDLREGVRFHNGALFDADDVVFTLNFATNPANRSPAITSIGWIDHTEKIEKYRVRIVSKGPFPAAIAYLAMPQLAIMPHDYYAKAGPKGMNEHPVGTGPYRVIEHALGKYIRLAKNPDYFKGGPKPAPKVDQVDIRFIPDAQTAVGETVAGGIDLIADVARDQANQLRDIGSLRVTAGDTLRYNFLLLNSRPDSPSPPLRDVRVRQAIMHAVDRETMATFLGGEGARVLHTKCHPGEFGCSDFGIQRYAYDPPKARQLLAEAGYRGGLDTDIYTYRDRNQVEALIGYLRAVGVRARLHYLQYSAAISARRSGRTAMAYIQGVSLHPEQPTALTFFHEFSADDLNRDPELRDVLVRADSSMDAAARRQAYAKGFALVAERAYALPLYTVQSYYVTAKDLVFAPRADEVLRFYEMSWK